MRGIVFSSIYGASTQRDTHVAPLGLWIVVIRFCHTHCAPLERGN